jgi:hypothetical protein
MNDTIYFDSKMDANQRRQAIHDGQLFVFTNRAPVVEFAKFTRAMIEEAFGPHAPETAQYEMPVEQYAAVLGRLKPQFIHHPESKRHVRAILEDLGCDPNKVHFDLPRLRSSTSDKYLTTGIAYAWHPHRDTWYSAPSCQINYWMPVYELESGNAMAFHPAYWGRPVPNNSRDYNYYVWNKVHRGPAVAKLTKEDPRPLPRPTVPLDVDPQIRVVCPVGGIIAFSSAQMHSSVPNMTGKTRFSIDFRVVHIDDALHRLGAPHTDEECTGTTMRDYLRCADLAHLPEDVIAMYDDGTSTLGNAVYAPR